MNNKLKEKAILVSKEIKNKKSNIHGTIFERAMKKALSLDSDIESNSLWDGYMKDGTPVSIKTTEFKEINKLGDGRIKVNGDIMLADFFSQAIDVNRDFYLILSEWKDFYFNIVSVKIYKIDIETWKTFFNYELVEDYSRTLRINSKLCKDIPHERNMWKEIMKVKGDKWSKETLNVIRPRPKNDCYIGSDNLKSSENRIQCALRRQALIDYFGHTEEVKILNIESYYKFAINDYYRQLEKERLEKEEKKKIKSSRKRKDKNKYFDLYMKIAERDRIEREKAKREQLIIELKQKEKRYYKELYNDYLIGKISDVVEFNYKLNLLEKYYE